MAQRTQRCRSCGSQLASDNSTGQCGACTAARRDSAPELPPVPPSFWQADELRGALESEHMGRVIRAYRLHPYWERHGWRRGLSQGEIARCAQTTQGVISKIENGRLPITHIDHLRFWGNVLRIPQRHLWFRLSQSSSFDEAPAPPSGEIDALTLHELKFMAHQLADKAAELEAGVDLSGDRPGVGSPPRVDVAVSPAGRGAPISVDSAAASPARMADYLMGGTAHFSVDRKVIEFVAGALPGGLDTARATVRASHEFHRRALRYLAGEGGIRQFLQAGARLPSSVRPHEVIAEVAPDARMLYVIDDYTVAAHVRELQRGATGAATKWLIASVYETADLLAQAAPELDFRKQIALSMVGGPKTSDVGAARDLVHQLFEPMVSGSCLVTTHLGNDLLGVEMSEVVRRYKQQRGVGRIPDLGLLSRDDIARLFDGLELVEPGIVPVDQWRPEQPPGSRTFMYAVVARKP